MEGPATPGSSCRVLNATGKFLGTGYFNPHSLIAVRLVSREMVDIDRIEFFQERIETALAYRKRLYPGEDALRIVYGESDQLPGLVIDKYGADISVQLLSLGMDSRRELIVAAIQRIFAPAAIVARNDAGVRELEGLSRGTELLTGQLTKPLLIVENGLLFKIDILDGQKTGTFLDQKENHRALQERVAGRRVLDLFCYSGSWSIHAASYGAAQVTGIDISRGAIELARENARLNQVESRCVFHAADAFELLKTYGHRGERFGAIILDPPAFVKSRKKLPEAVRGYLTVNRRALELLEPGGFLFTCSCSYHMGRELFLDTLRQAATQAGRQLRLLEVRGQAFDHPVLLACPETDYLKCVVLQVI
jgi:23S rRNA (cytosine1962-C5)-methyltransferase